MSTPIPTLDPSKTYRVRLDKERANGSLMRRQETTSGADDDLVRALSILVGRVAKRNLINDIRVRQLEFTQEVGAHRAALKELGWPERDSSDPQVQQSYQGLDNAYREINRLQRHVACLTYFQDVLPRKKGADFDAITASATAYDRRVMGHWSSKDAPLLKDVLLNWLGSLEEIRDVAKLSFSIEEIPDSQ